MADVHSDTAAPTGRALGFTSRGSPSQVLAITSIPIPTAQPPTPLPKDTTPTDEWIAVKVAYASLNPGALFVMGLLPARFRTAVAIPDTDLSGVVTEVYHPPAPAGSDGGPPPRFQKGDGIAAFLPIKHTLPTGTGALASHVRIPAKYATKKPEGVSFAAAGALMLAACTAWMLVEKADIKKGDRVLVNGAAGGIGSFVLQMVRDVIGKKGGREGYLVAVCSGRDGKLEMVKELGADEAIDYTIFQPLSSELTTRFSATPFDAIIDCIGIQDIYTHSPAYLKVDRPYSAVGIKPVAKTYWGFIRAFSQMLLNEHWPVSPWLLGVGRRWAPVAMMDATPELMATVMGLVAEGRVRVVIDKVVSLEEAAAAYEVIDRGEGKGKIVVRIDEEAT